jgi:hypothetical protein
MTSSVAHTLGAGSRSTASGPKVGESRPCLATSTIHREVVSYPECAGALQRVTQRGPSQNHEAAQQRVEADEAEHNGASQLNSVLDGPVSRPTERTRRLGVARHQLPLPERDPDSVSASARERRELHWLTGNDHGVVGAHGAPFVRSASRRLALQRGASSLPNGALRLLAEGRRSPATPLPSPASVMVRSNPSWRWRYHVGRGTAKRVSGRRCQ